MRTDGRRDMTKQIVAFRNYAKAPDKVKSHLAYKNLQYLATCSPNTYNQRCSACCAEDATYLKSERKRVLYITVIGIKTHEE